jgi:hypothetical protein
MKKILSKTSLLVILYSAFFAFISFFYLQKISAFGCFDDCNNIMGGYFLLKDKQIFSEFFFNHAPGLAYLSFFIQKLTNPDNIYDLILYHRISLFIFSFIAGVFLIYRFKLIAFLFLLAFESTKYFIFGDRFLAEGYIVYLIIYIFGLVLHKYSKQEIKSYDYYLTAIFGWIIIFTREPYIPLTLLLFFFLYLGKINRPKIISFMIFITLSIGALLILPVKELIQNVFVYNNKITASELAEKGGPIKVGFISLIYPVYVFFKGNQSIFRIIEQIISAVFLISIIRSAIEGKYKLILIIIIILGASNIRFVSPGDMFYGSFHMIIWFALLIFGAFYLILNSKLSKSYKFLLLAIPIFVCLFSLTSKESFTNRNINKNEEFSLSYNNYYIYGQAIKNLSNPNHTVYLEERDDLIYWVADRPSAYKYQWYTSLMPTVELYSSEREKMFGKNPPDFYYDACILRQRKQKDPQNYTRIKIFNAPSCLLIKKEVYKQIKENRWQSVAPLGFSKH